MRIFAAVMLAVLSTEGQPRVTNATLETRAVSGPLDGEFRAMVARQTTPAWIGYAVPVRSGGGRSCCFYSNNGTSWSGCYLEGNDWRGAVNPPAQQPGPVYLEGPPVAHILFRVEKGVVTKIQSFSGDCDLEGGGLPFIWLTGVKPVESLALLETFISPTDEKNHFRNSALGAMALHAGSAERLIEVAKSAKDARVKRQAIFWIGKMKDPQAIAFIDDILLK